MNHRIKHSFRSVWFYWAVILCLILVGCQGSIEKEASRLITTSPTPSQMPPAVKPDISAPSIPHPTETPQPIAEVVSLLLPTLTPTSNSLMLPTNSPAPFPTDSTKNYMLIGVNRLWHPDLPRGTQNLENMSFSVQPWSPDGRQLAALHQSDNSTSYVLFDLGSEALIPLENAAFASSRLSSSRTLSSAPIWSPDGRFLLYALSIEGDQDYSQIVIYDLTTQQETLLLSPVQLAQLVGWSFDSQKIAYTRWDAAAEEEKPILEIVEVSSQTPKQLTPTQELSIAKAHWSPTTNQLILFVDSVDKYDSLNTNGYDEIFLVDSQNGAFEQLKAFSTRDDEYFGNSDFPSYYVKGTPWAPDGQSIIYSDRGLLCSLIITSRQESCLTEVDKMLFQLGAVGGVYPGWSPSGEWISFVMKLDSVHCSPVAVVRPDGSDLRFTDAEMGDCSLFGPVWSPANLPGYSN